MPDNLRRNSDKYVHPFSGQSEQRRERNKDNPDLQKLDGWCCMSCKEHGEHSRAWCAAGCCDR